MEAKGGGEGRENDGGFHVSALEVKKDASLSNMILNRLDN